MQTLAGGKDRLAADVDFDVLKEFRMAVVSRHGQLRGHFTREVEEALRDRTRRLKQDATTPRAPAFGAH